MITLERALDLLAEWRAGTNAKVIGEREGISYQDTLKIIWWTIRIDALKPKVDPPHHNAA